MDLVVFDKSGNKLIPYLTKTANLYLHQNIDLIFQFIMMAELYTIG
jgi:hypothetical protein